jgi:hypothetical protein
LTLVLAFIEFFFYCTESVLVFFFFFRCCVCLFLTLFHALFIRRESIYFGETSYWVTYDINVPLFLPLYGQARLYDLRLIAEREDRTGVRLSGKWHVHVHIYWFVFVIFVCYYYLCACVCVFCYFSVVTMCFLMRQAKRRSTQAASGATG